MQVFILVLMMLLTLLPSSWGMWLSMHHCHCWHGVVDGDGPSMMLHCCHCSCFLVHGCALAPSWWQWWSGAVAHIVAFRYTGCCHSHHLWACSCTYVMSMQLARQWWWCSVCTVTHMPPPLSCPAGDGGGVCMVVHALLSFCLQSRWLPHCHGSIVDGLGLLTTPLCCGHCILWVGVARLQVCVDIVVVVSPRWQQQQCKCGHACLHCHLVSLAGGYGVGQ